MNTDIMRGMKADFLSFFKYGRRRYVLDNRKNKKEDDYISVACIIKNEGRFIKEFVEFHFLAGVDRIYIFDNGSNDNTKDILKPYIESGKIIYIFFPGEKMQFVAYRYAIRYCRKYTRWLAFLDADEFLFSPIGDIKNILRGFEDEVGIGVNWVCFGPSGHDKRPKGLVIENYVQTFKDKDHFFNRHIKSIVNPMQVESINSPHFCRYKGEKLAVDEKHMPIDGNAKNIPYKSMAFTGSNNVEKLRINHYITKSLEDLREKGKRGYPDGMPANVYEESVNRFNVPLIEDRDIFRFIPSLKEKLV
jgi:hypothetical protein